MTLHTQIAHFVRDANDWVPSSVIERRVFKDRTGSVAKPSNLSRRCRELESGDNHYEGTFGRHILAVRHMGTKREAQYRWIPPEHRSRYIPIAEREKTGKEELWRKVPETAVV